MSYLRFYIKPQDNSGGYSGDFTEITSDVDMSSLSSIKQNLENSEFDVGTFKYSDLNIKLRNDHGRYSEPGVEQSIFLEKRTDSIIKVTWSVEDNGPICGIAICGEAILSEEVVIFYGILNDSTSKQNIKDNRITFSIQGLESIFDRVETAYDSGDYSGNLFSDNIYTLLNKQKITNLMNIEESNISVGEDQIGNSYDDLEETTVKEALDLLLEASNSILYIDLGDQTLYVKPRTPSASVQKTFYGQASDNGSENIVDMKNITTGINRTFNFWKWSDNNQTSKDSTSIETYGVRKKEISNSLVTGSTEIQNLLDNYRDEFFAPKQELTLTTFLDTSTVSLYLLDRVAIDYPATLNSSPITNELPRWGNFVWGEAYYPFGTWSLTIPTTDNFKIIGRTINLKRNTIDLKLRKI